MTATLPALAFAGIGLMGLPMTRRLLAAGYPLTLWNRTPDKCAPLLELGAHRVENPAELCRDASVVMPVSYTHLDVYKRQGQYCAR